MVEGRADPLPQAADDEDWEDVAPEAGASGKHIYREVCKILAFFRVSADIDKAQASCFCKSQQVIK